ncbi:MAG TPA: choice-of-anchor D domain-containing protein, partial [Candidatus Binataceae bacterium]|nr:choice-of-anchor D domain-containing protein [Candidatus Binataceae bacterium]
SPTPTTTLTAAPSKFTLAETEPGASSAGHTVTLRNKGAVAATLGTVTTSEPNTFSVTADKCSGTTVAPKKDCTLEVVFTPQSPGAATPGTLVVPYNGTPPTVTLNGTGATVTLSASKSVAFGHAAAGSSGKTKTITVTNHTKVAVAIGISAVAGAEESSFTLVAGDDTCSESTLAAGSGCKIEVQFTPEASASGKQSATLNLPFTYGPQQTSGNLAVGLTGNL